MGHSGPSQLPGEDCGGEVYMEVRVRLLLMWLSCGSHVAVLGPSLAGTAVSGSPLWPDLSLHVA